MAQMHAGSQMHVVLTVQRSEVVSILQRMTSASDAPQGLPQVCWRFARRAGLRRCCNKGQCWRQEHLWHLRYIFASTAACALHSTQSMRLMKTQAIITFWEAYCYIDMQVYNQSMHNAV